MMLDRVGPFELEKLLGQGGVGEVYRARDRRDGHQVALKLVLLNSEPDVLFAERHGAELQKQIHARVPAVAKVLDIGDADGFLYIAMEYISGPVLSKILADRGGLTESSALAVAVQLSRLLEVFHDTTEDLVDRSRPLIHGDIKPDNIHLEGHLRVRLLDFGLARRLAHSEAQAKSDFGSIPYASPERLRDQALTPAADLWAVAVVLYEMVARRLPFPGKTEAEIQKIILSGVGPAPLPPGISPELEKLLFRALDPVPANRFPSARALCRALERVPAYGKDVGRTQRMDRSRPRPGEPWAGESVPTADSPNRSVGQAAVPPSPSRPRPRPTRPRRRLSARRLVFSLIVLSFLVVTAGELYTRVVAEEVDQALSTGDHTDLAALAEKYIAAARWDFLDWTRPSARRLEKELLTAARGTILDYRQGEVVSRDRWAAMKEQLALSQDIDGTDDDEQALYAFSLGQLSRLEALDRLGKSDMAGARKSWEEAERQFGETSRYAADLGAPFFALAALYLDSRHGPLDAGRLDTALKRAESHEKRPTPAERRLLAAGYERVGEFKEKLAASVADERVQGETLRDARQSFEKAAEHCRALGTIAGECLERCREDIARVRHQLQALGYAS